jgi:CheY-like chemotaxis protein
MSGSESVRPKEPDSNDRVAMILRAELQLESETIVAHTLEIGRNSIVIATDARVRTGDRLRVRLSFPRYIPEIIVEGRVLSKKADGGPGDPASIELALSETSEDARDRLRRLIALPLQLPDGPTKRSLSSKNRYRFLLVEDNTFIREVFAYAMGKYFAGRSAEVALDHAADGSEAWEMLTRRPYDLAIVDHYLPALTGSDLIARIRAEPKLAAMPVVAISVGGAEAHDAALAAGADIFLHKPVVSRDLFVTLEKLTTGTAP